MTPKPWPEKPTTDYALRQYETDWHDYDIARAEAALDRLRLAVEALKEIRSVHPLMHNGGNWDKFVDEALQAIGDFP